MRSAAAAVALAVLAQSGTAAPDLGRYFDGLDGTFVLLNGQTNQYVRYNGTRADERFPPCSTFKIPNTAILLESGVAPEPAWRLSAKTGSCRPAGEQTANWYVGYVDKGRDVYYFALELGDRDFGRAFSERVPIARAILTDLGILR